LAATAQPSRAAPTALAHHERAARDARLDLIGRLEDFDADFRRERLTPRP
jgi:hypothetical protein